MPLLSHPNRSEDERPATPSVKNAFMDHRCSNRQFCNHKTCLDCIVVHHEEVIVCWACEADTLNDYRMEDECYKCGRIYDSLCIKFWDWGEEACRLGVGRCFRSENEDCVTCKSYKDREGKDGHDGRMTLREYEEEWATDTDMPDIAVYNGVMMTRAEADAMVRDAELAAAEAAAAAEEEEE